ncbi:hypothetical protein FACS189450_06300 [Spirochaetia bacterium]|nr:hypothetical protein FACS189450_06300 [Spirochaetia bacterium]
MYSGNDLTKIKPVLKIANRICLIQTFGGKPMKLVYVLALLYFSSCTNQNNFITECINLIGKNVPVEYGFENKNKYTKRIGIDNNEIFITVITGNDDKIQSCYISFSFSDFVEAKKYYTNCINYLKKEKWQFIKDINKYKRENGKLYLKNELYFGIYERVYYTVPIGLSTNDKNFLEEGFCE